MTFLQELAVPKRGVGKQETSTISMTKETSCISLIHWHKASNNRWEATVILRGSPSELGSSETVANSYEIVTSIGTKACVDSPSDYNPLGCTQIADAFYAT